MTLGSPIALFVLCLYCYFFVLLLNGALWTSNVLDTPEPVSQGAEFTTSQKEAVKCEREWKTRGEYHSLIRDWENQIFIKTLSLSSGLECCIL